GYADAGIGGGWIKHGTVANTIAVNSHVRTGGQGSTAKIGGGYIEGSGTVTKTKAENSYVNGELKNFGSISKDQLCQNADLRVLTANCSPRTEFRDALDLLVCPVNAATVSTPATASTAAIESTAVAAANATVSTAAAAANATVSTAAAAANATVSTAAAAANATVSIAATASAPATASTPTTASTAPKEPTAAPAAATVSTDATASTAATVGGITTGSLMVAGGLGLGIAAYSTYQWITGYQEGLRGQELAMKPLTRGKELASAAVNSVSQGIQGIRERMNRQSVSTQEPAHEMSQKPAETSIRS
ncbi:hypothetical protein J7438_24580, partial [Thalassotalea sp. G20_0]|uniref:hypothetical protein n=1 Tax=Thalassotalea sp. G20_0 TaxID=2821093 RepID=UPI001ADB472A